MKKSSLDPTPEGILLVNKGLGPTSFQVIGSLRRALNTRAVGHAGTLDPLAEGLLVVLVGRYTRLSAYLTAHDKRYVAAISFLGSTNTDDAEGEILHAGDPTTLVPHKIDAALAKMEGKQLQTPPMFSAIQINGERLYKKARRGETVEVPQREVTFYSLKMTSFQCPVATVEVHCSKGTYVRALARDLGEKLGIPAHLGGLVRSASGDYQLADAHDLDFLMEGENAKKSLRVGPQAILGLPTVQIDSQEARKLECGQRVRRSDLSAEVHLACHKDRLVALVKRIGLDMVCVRGFGGESSG
jgi:tRNA pseudouridine55 synthase